MRWHGIKLELAPLSVVILLFAAILLSACDGGRGGDSSAQAEAPGPAGTAPAMAVKGSSPSPADIMDNGGPPVGTGSKDSGRVGPWTGAPSGGAAAQGTAVRDSAVQGSAVRASAVQESAVQDAAPDPQAVAFNYTVRSASAMPVGARVSVVRADISGSCFMPGQVAAFSPVASGAVTNAGSVSLLFNDIRDRPFIEIIYIDSNDSGHLDAGDRVWGSNPKDPAGICFSPGMNSANRVDWDGVAAVIGGSATYSGDFQDFLAAAAGESQILAGSLIIGESGYGDL